MTDLYPSLGNEPQPTPNVAATGGSPNPVPEGFPPGQAPAQMPMSQQSFSVAPEQQPLQQPLQQTLSEAPLIAGPFDKTGPNIPTPGGFTTLQASRPTTPNTTDITQMVERIPRVIVSEVPRVRTYADDIKTALSRDSMSLSRIALEEQKRRDKLAASQAVSPTNPKNVALVIFSAVLVAGAAGAIWYFTTQVNKDPVETVIVDANIGIVPFDNKIELQFVNATRASISDDIAKVSTQALTKSTIASVYYKDEVGDDVTTSVFLARLGGRAPEQLVRALDNRFTLGIYSDTINTPFIVLKTDSYQTAYAGMLSWEPRLAIDMDSIIYRRAYIAGTPDAPAGQYVDRIVANRDMRAYVDQTNRVLFYYGFITNDLIIIAPNEATIIAIVDRIQRQGVRR
jgi:hypothetical protein